MMMQGKERDEGRQRRGLEMIQGNGNTRKGRTRVKRKREVREKEIKINRCGDTRKGEDDDKGKEKVKKGDREEERR